MTVDSGHVSDLGQKHHIITALLSAYVVKLYLLQLKVRIPKMIND